MLFCLSHAATCVFTLQVNSHTEALLIKMLQGSISAAAAAAVAPAKTLASELKKKKIYRLKKTNE